MCHPSGTNGNKDFLGPAWLNTQESREHLERDSGSYNLKGRGRV